MRIIFTFFLFSVSLFAQAQIEKILLGHLSGADPSRQEPVISICGMRGCSLPTGFEQVPSVPTLTPDRGRPELRLHRSPHVDTASKPLLTPVKYAQDAAKPAGIRIRCGSGYPRSDKEPILLVDGILADSLACFRQLDTAAIDDITILQSPAALAIFGPVASSGAIIVTTKKMLERTLQVLDITDQQPVARATVRMESTDGQSVFQYIASDSGCLVSRDWLTSKAWRIHITAAGYQPLQTIITRAQLSEQRLTIKMTRNVITCRYEALVLALQPRRIGCGLRTMMQTRQEAARPENITAAAPMQVFPNPVQRGGIISIRLHTANREPARLSLLQSDGSLLWSQPVQWVPGENRIPLRVSTAWAGGSYFIRLQYANGRIAASEQVIIQ